DVDRGRLAALRERCGEFRQRLHRRPVYRFAAGVVVDPHIAGSSGCSATLRSAYLRLFRIEKTDGAQVSWRRRRRDRLLLSAPHVAAYAAARVRADPGQQGRRGAKPRAVPGAGRRDRRGRAEPRAYRSFRPAPAAAPPRLPRSDLYAFGDPRALLDHAPRLGVPAREGCRAGEQEKTAERVADDRAALYAGRRAGRDGALPRPRVRRAARDSAWGRDS